jgi:hypothetical protein
MDRPLQVFVVVFAPAFTASPGMPTRILPSTAERKDSILRLLTEPDVALSFSP